MPVTNKTARNGGQFQDDSSTITLDNEVSNKESIGGGLWNAKIGLSSSAIIAPAGAGDPRRHRPPSPPSQHSRTT